MSEQQREPMWKDADEEEIETPEPEVELTLIDADDDLAQNNYDSAEMPGSEMERYTDRVKTAAFYATRGVPWVEIARMCGYTSSAVAMSAVNRFIAANTPPMNLEATRNIQRSRLLAELREANSQPRKITEVIHHKDGTDETIKVPNPQALEYSKHRLALIKEISVLEGTNMPTKVEFQNPDAKEFDGLMRMALQASRSGPAEGDPFAHDPIIEAEVVSDTGVVEPDEADDA